MRSEWCVAISGDVAARTEGNVNAALVTGEIEIVARSIVVLSESEPVPFPIDDADEID